MKITANLNGVTCGSEFVALGQFPEQAAVTAKIEEPGGRGAKLVLVWSDAADAWEVTVNALPSIPLLPVTLPASFAREEIEIEVEAVESATVTLTRGRRASAAPRVRPVLPVFALAGGVVLSVFGCGPGTDPEGKCEAAGGSYECDGIIRPDGGEHCWCDMSKAE